jgi:hypothetical protein
VPDGRSFQLGQFRIICGSPFVSVPERNPFH